MIKETISKALGDSNIGVDALIEAHRSAAHAIELLRNVTKQPTSVFVRADGSMQLSWTIGVNKKAVGISLNIVDGHSLLESKMLSDGKIINSTKLTFDKNHSYDAIPQMWELLINEGGSYDIHAHSDQRQR